MNELPTAGSRPRRRWAWWWLLPLAAAALSTFLLWQAVAQQGPLLRIRFDQGHGLKAGDALKHRGIEVGRVERVLLTDDLQAVTVDLRLQPQASGLARRDSRFWIVRPQLDFDGVSGLDTVIGARYIGVLPGGGASAWLFDGLAEPPVADVLEPGGRELLLISPGSNRLRAGIALRYRDVVVGRVLDVALAPDGSEVRARAWVAPAYAALVRDNARFWLEGGAKLSAGLSGVALDVGSLASLVSGGIAFAVPPQLGAEVADGHRFRLFAEERPEWRDWRPAFPASGEHLPIGQARPQPQVALLSWQARSWYGVKQPHVREGLVLRYGNSLLAPADLFAAEAEGAELAVPAAGLSVLASQIKAEVLAPGLLQAPLDAPMPAWPRRRSRAPQVGEPLWVVGAPSWPLRELPPSHVDGNWQLSGETGFDARWHGAAVVAANDGALVGLLRVVPGESRILPLEAQP